MASREEFRDLLDKLVRSRKRWTVANWVLGLLIFPAGAVYVAIRLLPAATPAPADLRDGGILTADAQARSNVVMVVKTAVSAPDVPVAPPPSNAADPRADTSGRTSRKLASTTQGDHHPTGKRKGATAPDAGGVSSQSLTITCPQKPRDDASVEINSDAEVSPQDGEYRWTTTGVKGQKGQASVYCQDEHNFWNHQRQARGKKRCKRLIVVVPRDAHWKPPTSPADLFTSCDAFAAVGDSASQSDR